MYEREVGLFGFWAYSRGHDQAVESVKEETGWRLVPLIVDGLLVVPSTASVIEYVLKMATSGDASVPKGGDPACRSGDWYEACFGQKQGGMMTEANAKEYGHGAHADEPYRFVTIERKLTALRKWYDELRRGAQRDDDRESGAQQPPLEGDVDAREADGARAQAHHADAA